MTKSTQVMLNFDVKLSQIYTFVTIHATQADSFLELANSWIYLRFVEHTDDTVL